MNHTFEGAASGDARRKELRGDRAVVVGAVHLLIVQKGMETVREFEDQADPTASRTAISDGDDFAGAQSDLADCRSRVFLSPRHGNNSDGWSPVDMLGFLSNNSGNCYAFHLRKR